MRPRQFTLGSVVVVVLVVASPARAQIRASERATISQTVDGTTITVDYARPRARTRDSLFGKVVHWGEVWTPGANWATTLELDKDVQINGNPVAKGKYSVWMIIHPGEWTMILDTTPKLFHVPPPDTTKESQIRFRITPESRNPPEEVLTFSFPQVKSDGMVLAMQWGSMYVPLRIKVTASHPITLAATRAPPYPGSYSFEWVESESDSAESAASDEHEHAGADSTPADVGPGTLTVSYENGSLWAVMDPEPFPGFSKMVLIPIADGWFIPGWWIDGELYDVSDDMVIEFKIQGGKATGFDIRVEDDEIIGRGERKP